MLVAFCPVACCPGLKYKYQVNSTPFVCSARVSGRQWRCCMAWLVWGWRWPDGAALALSWHTFHRSTTAARRRRTATETRRMRAATGRRRPARRSGLRRWGGTQCRAGCGWWTGKCRSRGRATRPVEVQATYRLWLAVFYADRHRHRWSRWVTVTSEATQWRSSCTQTLANTLDLTLIGRPI